MTMHYKVQNVTMLIDITPEDITGDCIVYIPKANERFFSEWCGVEPYEGTEEYEPAYESDFGPIFYDENLGKFHASSPDTLITYLAWLLSEPGEQTIEVEYADPFWAIHDAEHAQHDESGCTLYVDEYIELERLRDAFKLMKEHGFEPSYELIEDVTEAYNGRFGTNQSFEEFLELDEDFNDEKE